MFKGKIILILLLFSGFVFSQAVRYDKTVDERTYKLFMAKKWDEMLELADSALSEGIDFYYLRMRTGIVYYEKENYMSAIPNFEKALEFNNRDTLAMEYLYYANLFSGMVSEANILAKSFPQSLKSKIGYKKQEFFKGFYSEGGYIYNGKYDDNKNKRISGNQQILGEQKLMKNGIYVTFNSIHQIGDRITIFQGYTNNMINYLKRFNLQSNIFKNFDVNTFQNEYYLSTGVYLGKGITFVGSFHYLNVKTEDIEGSPNNSNFNKITETLNDYVFALELGKRVGHFDLGISSGFSRLNYANQLQNSFTVVWYPFGNLNLYFVNSFILHSNKEEKEKDYSSKFIYFAKAGFKVTDAIWIESNFTLGDIFNYYENSAFIVYNNMDRIKYKYELTFISPVSKDLELSLRYQFHPQELVTKEYTSNTQYTTIIENIHIHKLIGGIKWTF